MMAATFLLVIFTSILVAVYAWMRHSFSYWRRHNVPFVGTTPFLGSLTDMLCMKASMGEMLAGFYNHPKAVDQPILGLHVLHKPGLLIREPELIKQIMVKDFSKFSNRYATPDSHGDFLGAQNLFFVKNPAWKEIRAKLTPVFTSGKLKQMFPLVVETSKKLDSYLLSNSDNPTKSVELEIKEINASFSNDVIANVAFGVQINSFTNPNNDFRVNGKKIFSFTPIRAFEIFLIFFVPKLVSIMGCKVFSKDASTFLNESITYMMKERAKSGLVRNDLIDTLLAFKKEAEVDPEKKKFATDDFLIAQAALFFTAGFETSSSTVSFALYELAKNPEVQERVREELRDALQENDGKITYEMIHDMKLLSAVISETLRLYPSLPMLERECTLPAGEESYSLEPFSSFSIPNGMPIYFPVYGIQRDPKYFPEPEKFDPERFLSEKDNIQPYTYMPFGTGPHNCIGERMGLIQAKMGIISFLLNHVVAKSPRTVPEIVYDAKAVALRSIDGIFVNIIRHPLL